MIPKEKIIGYSTSKANQESNETPTDVRSFIKGAEFMKKEFIDLLYKFNNDLYDKYSEEIESHFTFTSGKEKIIIPFFEEWQIDMWLDKNIRITGRFP